MLSLDVFKENKLLLIVCYLQTFNPGHLPFDLFTLRRFSFGDKKWKMQITFFQQIHRCTHNVAEIHKNVNMNENVRLNRVFCLLPLDISV